LVVALTLTIDPTASVAGDAEALSVKLGVVAGRGVGPGATIVETRSNGATTVAVTGVPADVIFVPVAVIRCRPTFASNGATREAANEPRPFA
jgi:hypothetical protein